MAKNYFAFLNDESGSMSSLRQAALNDYNANISAVKDAATREMQDTIVSMFTFGGTVTRKVVNSNPHVLKPQTSWRASGGTPMNAAILEAINLFKSMPDYKDPEVSFVIMATTDGAATDHNYATAAANAIKELARDERWTFVFRVPSGHASNLGYLGVPSGNVQEWETTAAGMAKSTAATTAAIDTFYATRSAGKKGSNTFYTSTAAVDVSKLTNIKDRTSLYIVDPTQDGIQIRDFILTKRMEYLIGAAFYQLTKTENRVSPSKLILIRDRTSGDVFAGPDARKMLGLDTLNNARLNPNHGNGNYDIFIQSESVNRKLVKGTGILYWAEQGRPVTQADLDKYAGQNKPAAAPAVPVLAQAPATGRPTPSPVAAKAKQPTKLEFVTRYEGRTAARLHGKPLQDAGKGAAKRWFIIL